MTINLSDVNDNAPVLTVDNATVSLAEDAVAGVITGADADATDADGTAANNTVTFSLVTPPEDGEGEALFSIDATTGQISLTAAGAAAIDYESATKSYTLTVKASDGLEAHDQTKTVTINLSDVNEFNVSTPTDSDNSANTVAENAAVNTTVGVTASASDADGTTNTVSYSLVNQDGTAYAGTEFKIGASDGVVKVAGTIDREAGATRTIYVKATSADGSTATSSFTIGVTNVNEYPILFSDDNSNVVNVSEGLVENALVGVNVDGSDADGGTTITYSLVTDFTGAVAYSGNEFKVNSSTGVVSAGSQFLVYDSVTPANNDRTIFVKATSSDGSEAIQVYNLKVTDDPNFFWDSDTGNTITGTSSADRVFGNGGNDEIIAGLGVDTIESGNGADQISLTIGSSAESDYVVYQINSVNGVQTAADSPAYGSNTGYDIITGVETARDVLVFNEFVPGTGRKLDGTNGSSVTGGLNAGITSTASVLVVESSAVAAGSSLTVDIAAALNAAFDLSSLKDGEEMLFSVKAANIDGDGNTSQYWVGIFNNTVVDDVNVAGEIQVVALVTQADSGGIDWDNFRNEVPSTPLIGGTPNSSTLTFDSTPTDDATKTPFTDPVTDGTSHFPIVVGNRFMGMTYVSDFVPGVTQLPVPPTFLGTGDDEVHNQQFEVYYGSYDFATGIFTVTSTPSSPPSVPTSHTLILYDNDSTSNVEFIEGLVFDGFMRESGWSINNGGTANATLQFTPPAGTLYGTPGADTLTGTASAELIQGLAANDSLSGGDGVDTIAGGAGDDTLVGGLGNDVLIGGLGNDTFSYVSGDGLDTFKDFGVGDVYDTDFVTTSGNYKVVSATADPLAGLSLDISSTTGAGVFQFTADFADTLFNTGSVLDATQMDALLKTIDSDGIVDLNATSGRFMFVMTDTSTNNSHLYQVVDTTGADSRVGSGDTGGLTLVGIFEGMTQPWTTGYIA